jgi:hypothetical protein
MPSVPVIVLAATNHQQAAITDHNVQKQIEALWQKSEQQLATGSHGRLVVVPSGHDIQLLKPDAVISALMRAMPLATRDRTDSPHDRGGRRRVAADD